MENKEIKYTEKQLEVINHGKGNLLVSASAGSGKTKVLVAKIINMLLKKQVKLKELLVVTFTNDASLELKQRILTELQNSEDEELLKQLDDLTVTDILTFDKFCIKVVREFGYQIGVNNNFGVADNSLSMFLQSKALDNVMAAHNKKLDEKFVNLMNAFFAKRNDKSLKNNIVRIYNFLRSKNSNNHYKEILNKTYEPDFNKNIAIKNYVDYILKNANLCLAKLDSLILQAQQLCSEKILKVLNECKQKIDVLNTYSVSQNIKYVAYDLSLPTFGNVKLSAEETELKEEYNKLKNSFNKLTEPLKEELQFVNFNEIESHMLQTKENLAYIIEMVEEFDAEYSRLKNFNQVLDFNDIECFAERILCDENVSTALQNKYKYIFVDEYQDTNELQESIIKKVTSGENLFMVGDVKQSIYRFRHAEPQIFINKYNLYKDFQTSNSVVELNKNFRSEPGILEFANMVFDKIMIEETAGINYKETARLEFGKAEAVSGKNNVKVIVIDKTEAPENEDIENHVLDSNNKAAANNKETANNKDAESNANINLQSNSCGLTKATENIYSVKNATLKLDNLSSLQKEAVVIADEITKLVGSKITLADGTEKVVNCSDIAILSRKKSKVMLEIKNIFSQIGIPVSCQFSSKLYESLDVQLIINILQTISNCQNDVALITSLSSIFGGLSFNDLAEIRNCDKQSEFFFEAVQNYMQQNKNDLTAKLHNFFNKLEYYNQQLNYMDLCEFVSSMIVRENLATYFSINGLGAEFNRHIDLLLQDINSVKNKSLVEYLNYVNTFATESTFEETIKDADDAVTLSTIHASKGLEFPIVFLIDSASDFSTQSTKEKILADNEFGIASKSVNFKDRFEYSSPVTIAFKHKIREEEKKEEMRLLYVALTRPKNQLYVVGTTNLSKVESIEFTNDIMQKNNYLEWILGSINKANLESLKSSGESIVDYENQKFQFEKYKGDFDIVNKLNLANNFIENESQQFNDILSIKYEESTMSKKQSASQLLAEENVAIPYVKGVGEDTDFLLIGNTYHKFMELLNFNEDIDAQIACLKNNNVVTDEELKIVDLFTIKTAVNNINKFIDKSDIVLKEKQFLCGIPASVLGSKDSTESILVQGVADLIIIKPDEIVLIDYKTSRIKDEKLMADKYSTQLNLYATAIENFYNKKVTKKIIYSFYLNKEIII